MDEQLIRYLEAMAEKGISVYIGMPRGGCLDLDPADVDFIINEGLDAFWAKHYSVSTGLYNHWNHVRTTGTCTGTTKRGYPCASQLRSADIDLHPTAMVQGWHDRCHLHRDNNKKPEDFTL